MDGGVETTGYFFNRIGNFTEGCAVMSRLYRKFKQVAVFTAFCRFGDRFQIAGNSLRITNASQFFQTFNLCITNSGIVDGQYVQRIFLRQTVLVQADNGFLTAVDIRLTAGSAFFDAHLRQAGRNSFCHAAQSFDFLDMRPGTADDFICQVFYIVGTAPRINDLAGFCFILDIKLCITCQTCGKVGRQRDSFVKRVGMERLGMAQSRRHGFHTSTGDIIERILFRQRPAGCLGMGTKCHGFRILRAELFQNFCPENAGRSHLCDFHKIVLALIPEERQTFGEGIDRKTRLFTAADVFHAIRQCITDFKVTGSAAFLDMVTGNGDTVELRHIVGGIFENITDDTHGHGRRINVSITNHELFQDIILDRACQNLLVYALFDTGTDEECQNRKNGAVHRHGYGHLVQRNACEEDIHIKHGADGYACFADVTDNTGVIRIIAAVGRKVKCDRQPFLACRQVSAVERIRFFSSGEPCVLAYRPRAEYIHRRVRSAQERRDTAHVIQVIALVIHIFAVERTYRNTFHRIFIESIIIFARRFFQFRFPFVIRTMGMFFKV